MLGALFQKPAEVRAQATTWGAWQGDPATTTEVSQTSAMQLLAVSGCVRYITDTISTLPIDTFTEDPQTGVRTETVKPVWLKQPTIDLDFSDWCSQVITSLLLHGNAFVVITRSDARIVEMLPIDPMKVTVKRENGRKVFYGPGGVPFAGEMLHIKGMMFPGADMGVSPLEYSRLTIQLGLSALQYGRDNFDNDLNMPGVIEFPKAVTPDLLKSTAIAWKRARKGPNGRGLPGVLQEGAQWKATGVTSEQAQFLQTRQWTAAEIAGQVFLIDPTELGIPVSGTSIQYGNMEQRSLASWRRGFQPLAIRIEKAISGLLPNPRFMKFNVDGLLRGDSTARWDVYGKAMTINAQAALIGQPAVMTTAEMRDFEDLGVVEEYPLPAPAVPAMPAVPDVPVQTNAAHDGPDMHFHLPESIDVQLRQMEPVVVPAPIVNVPAPIVNVAAPEARTVTRTVERDGNGRIATIIETES